MLRPQSNDFRTAIDLSGLFEFAFDFEAQGERRRWFERKPRTVPIAVPGSWNDQFQDRKARYFLGSGWYFKEIVVPPEWQGRRVHLRIGSATFLTRLWFNGRDLGGFEHGFLPSDWELTPNVRWGKPNFLAIKVTGQEGLRADTLPMQRAGLLRPPPKKREIGVGGTDVSFAGNPASSADYFPYAGIHRPVVLHSTPRTFLARARAFPSLKGRMGRLDLSVEINGPSGDAIEVVVAGRREIARLSGRRAARRFEIQGVRPWSPKDPHLHDLELRLLDKGEVVDRYRMAVGFRSFEVKGPRLLLNGRPVFLKGFGKHEDFPVFGKGLALPVAVKDFELLKWCGANSFRTSHYPYAEEIMDLADRLGVLVIDEVPATAFGNFDLVTEGTLAAHRESLSLMIERDAHHPSVVSWCVANEPRSNNAKAARYFAALARHVRREDRSRPVILVSAVGIDDLALRHFDYVCFNRYFGWYTQAADLDRAAALLREELRALWRRHRKPVVLAEFGVDTLSGLHSDPPEMFSEEFQVEFTRRYLDVLESEPFVAGAHVWNFADFKTSQGIHRVMYNRKGVFTRDRQPKMAAHFLRERWGGAR